MKTQTKTPPPQKTAQKPKTSEANNLTNAVKNYCALQGAFAFRVNTQGQYDTQLGRFRKSGSTKGVSDLIACFEGRLIGIEIKVGKDKLNDYQKEFKRNIENAGGIYFECRNIESFIEFFKKIKNNDRA